jgi:hypothetical protein
MSTLKSSAEHLTLNADGSGNDIKFQSNATEVAAIDQAGNLTLSGTVDGVDIAARDAILTSTTTTAGAALPKAGGTMTGNLTVSKADDARLVLTDTGDSSTFMIRSDGANTSIGTDTAHPVRITTNNTERLRITSDGKVGIGTTSPDERLQVIGFNAGTDEAIITWARPDEAVGGFLGYDGDANNVTIGSQSGHNLSFSVGGINNHKMTIDTSGNVGIGVTPSGWPSSGDFKALQIGTGAAVYGRGSGDESKSGLTANAYLDGTDDRFEYIGNSYASHYRQSDGNHTFWTAPSGSADAAITFTNVLDIGRDGKVSTWQGSGMTSHFNVGNRDIDVGTSTGFANRQERIGLMAADPWGTAAGIYLSVSRNTNQDGRSHPSLHFTGNHGAGQSENYLIMSMNSNFYGAESVNIGSSANDANLEVNGHSTAIKQPAFKQGWDSMNSGSSRTLATNSSGISVVTDRDVFNIGSHFNAANGRFTAPVAGTYVFGFSLMRNGSNGSGVDARIKKNGSLMYARYYVSSYTSSYEVATLTTTTNCAVGDYFTVELSGAMSLYSDDSYSFGHLLG